MNNFRDHTGAQVMLFGTAPPPPPGYTADWMSRHSSSRPGTASSARDSDAFSDSSRDNDDDRLMDQAFQMMEGAEEETFLVPEVGPEVDDTNLSARWSDPGMYSEERWNECYPATPWEDMEEDLKVAELRIAIWDTDVAAAALYSGQVGNQCQDLIMNKALIQERKNIGTYFVLGLPTKMQFVPPWLGARSNLR